MGKALIIKGADFGAVAVSEQPVVTSSRWLLELTDDKLALAANGNSFYRPSNPEDIAYAFAEGADTALLGKTVKKTKFYAHKTGSIKFCRVNRTTFEYDCIQTLSVTETGIVTLNFTTPMKVDSQHTIGIMYTTDVATKYMTNINNGYQFAMFDRSAETVGSDICGFIIDYAY